MLSLSMSILSSVLLIDCLSSLTNGDEDNRVFYGDGVPKPMKRIEPPG